MQKGNVLGVRTDASGKVVWQKTLLSGFVADPGMFGSFVDDEVRVRLLADGSFLVSGTYDGRVFIGDASTDFQVRLGPSPGRSLVVLVFKPDGTFSMNWNDNAPVDDHDERALAVETLSDGRMLLGGSCHGDVDVGGGATFPCGPMPTGYLLTLDAEGNILGPPPLFAASTVYASDQPQAPRSSSVHDFARDSTDALYVSGTFEASMLAGTSTPDVSAGEDDGFLMKLAPDGTRAWITTASGLGHERGGRVARVPGGTLWTSRVSLGGSVGAVPFAEAGHVIAKVSDTGAVLWALPVPAARGALPLGVAAAADGSFALYGEGFLGRFDANGGVLWQGTGPDVRGAAFTSATPAQLVVAANVLGTTLFGASVSTGPEGVLRGALVAFPPGK